MKYTIVGKTGTGIHDSIFKSEKHTRKHLPNILESQKNLKDEGEIHVFNDESTLNYVTELISQQGCFSGWIRGHQRFGLMFKEQIGYRLDQDGNVLPLHYAEMKINKSKEYHVIPRTKPST